MCRKPSNAAGCLLVLMLGMSSGFIVPDTPGGVSCGVRYQLTLSMSTDLQQQQEGGDENPIITSRRKALSFITTATASVLASAVAEPASARDELFKPNPLTNPVLEKVRIWNQAEADNISYGGELAPGSIKGRAAYAKLLVPILGIEKDLLAANELVRVPDGKGLTQANDILSKSEFEKISFKKIFNAFADNIYYSDPDRANLYLGGGATPKNEQSIAYLLRNDVLTNVEALQAEITYLIKQKKNIEAGTEEGPLETEDLYVYAQTAVDGMKKYLELVPPGELKMGRELFASN
uniref:Uncharacterized protein n=1 Tax=Helicotheca tamesis TaxID=374047 RepID=A0A7S2IB95_9STRA|mmetsp:Transcript_7170/g.9731  ORF Transcript_7170/g.9731 Transcript_7170/m.9731 type:complete len:293 (+) Transcript_7170:109-987(+)